MMKFSKISDLIFESEQFLLAMRPEVRQIAESQNETFSLQRVFFCNFNSNPLQDLNARSFRFNKGFASSSKNWKLPHLIVLGFIHSVLKMLNSFIKIKGSDGNLEFFEKEFKIQQRTPMSV